LRLTTASTYAVTLTGNAHQFVSLPIDATAMDGTT
jgi:hypothetical protein